MRETPRRRETDGVDDIAQSEPDGLEEKEWS
jgi:hypothetical protein